MLSKVLNKITNFFVSMRPSTVLLALMVGIFLTFNSGYEWYVVLLQTISFYLGTGGGMLINNIFDVELDGSTKDASKVGAGKLLKDKADVNRERLKFLFLLFASWLVQIVLFKNIESFVFFLILCIAVIVYTPLIKHRIGILKTPFVAWMSVSPLIFAVLYSGNDLRDFVVQVFLVFLFFLGRENFLDYRDRVSDKEAGVRTLYYFFNERWVVYFASILILIGTFFSGFFTSTKLGLILAGFNFIYSLWMIIVWANNKEKINIIRTGTYLIMLLFILSLFVGL
jgi:4-hydroxybenzoate polyprenyltransferase